MESLSLNGNGQSSQFSLPDTFPKAATLWVRGGKSVHQGSEMPPQRNLEEHISL